MVFAASYNVLYAKNGSLANPTILIQEAAYSFQTKLVKLQCSSASCASGSSAFNLEVITSVNFIDVSETLASSNNLLTTLDETPENIFYPLFGYNSSLSSYHCVSLLFLCCTLLASISPTLFY